MLRAPKRFVNDFYKMGLANVGRVGKRRKIDKNLYEVSIVNVNRERKQIKKIPSWVSARNLMSGATMTAGGIIFLLLG